MSRLDRLEAATRRLREWRWPETDGEPVCPFCGFSKVYLFETSRRADRFKCKLCVRRFSATAGTLFHSTKLSDAQVLLAIELLAEPEWPSLRYAADRLGVDYRSIWYLYGKAPEPRPRLATTGLGRPGTGIAFQRVKERAYVRSQRRPVVTVTVGVERTCDGIECGRRYVPKHHRQLYHDPYCQVASANARQAIRMEAAVEDRVTRRDGFLKETYERGVAAGRAEERDRLTAELTELRLERDRLKIELGRVQTDTIDITNRYRAENERLANLVANQEVLRRRDVAAARRAGYEAGRKVVEVRRPVQEPARATAPFSLTGSRPIADLRPPVRSRTVVELTAPAVLGGSSLASP